MVKEFKFKEGVTFEDAVANVKEGASAMFPNEKIAFVGIKYYMLAEESDILFSPAMTTIDLTKYEE